MDKKGKCDKRIAMMVRRTNPNKTKFRPWRSKCCLKPKMCKRDQFDEWTFGETRRRRREAEKKQAAMARIEELRCTFNANS